MAAPTAPQARKELERELYNRAYSVNPNVIWNADRVRHLQESEEYFCLRLKELVRNKRVLEIGMGNGAHCILAAKAGATEVIGVDISQAAVELARKCARDAGLHQGIQFLEATLKARAKHLVNSTSLSITKYSRSSFMGSCQSSLTEAAPSRRDFIWHGVS